MRKPSFEKGKAIIKQKLQEGEKVEKKRNPVFRERSNKEPYKEKQRQGVVEHL
jgi:hypothetical protein